MSWEAVAPQDADDDYEEEEPYLLHNLAEKGNVDQLRVLLPSESSSRLRVLSSDSHLLEKDDMGFLPLHVAVIHQQTQSALHLLRYSSALTSAMLHLKGGDFNTPFLHLLLRVGAINASFAELLLRELLDDSPKGDDGDFYSDDLRELLFVKVAARDEEGNSLFHLCARYNLLECLEVLTTFYERHYLTLETLEIEEEKKKPLKLESLLERSNKVGLRPLHEAMKYHSTEVARRLVNEYKVALNPVTPLRQTPAHFAALANFADGVEILRSGGANFALTDSHGYTCAQLARKCDFKSLEERLLAAEVGKDIVPSIRDIVAAKDQTKFFFHPEVWKHLPMAYHRRGGPDPPPENPERIDTLVDPVFGILRSREFQQPNVKWDYDIERADIADILRVHEFHYVDNLRKKCASLAASNVGKNSVTSKSKYDDSEECHETFSLDPDTALSVRSYDAAARAAGAVCKAVDEVVAGKCKNAFCIVRPPGHHAGPVGKVVCANDPEGSLGFCLFNNVAIGAAYARSHFKNLGIHKVAILDFDVHHGNGTEEIVHQLVPVTKEIKYETPYGIGKQLVHQYKPWRNENDSENVFFCSVHGYGRKDPENKEELAQNEVPGWFYPGSGVSNVTETPRIYDEGMEFCHEGASASRLKWRSAFRDRILPKLRQFNPDLIFLSSGFDAHKKELVNWGYISLLEQDYEWLVTHVKQIATSCCQGKVISVLEGGYNFHGRMVSPFARSVAAHTRALINPAKAQWDEEEIAKEAAYEEGLLAKYLAPVTKDVALLQTKKRKSETGLSIAQTRSKRTRTDVDYAALAKELTED